MTFPAELVHECVLLKGRLADLARGARLLLPFVVTDIVDEAAIFHDREIAGPFGLVAYPNFAVECADAVRIVSTAEFRTNIDDFDVTARSEGAETEDE